MRSLDEIYDRLGDLPFTAEFKYDGQRAQIHAVRNGGGVVDVKIFSRHLEDMTDKVTCKFPSRRAYFTTPVALVSRRRRCCVDDF